MNKVKFINEVEKFGKQYGVDYFCATDGYFISSGGENGTVKNARESYMKWIKERGYVRNILVVDPGLSEKDSICIVESFHDENGKVTVTLFNNCSIMDIYRNYNCEYIILNIVGFGLKLYDDLKDKAIVHPIKWTGEKLMETTLKLKSMKNDEKQNSKYIKNQCMSAILEELDSIQIIQTENGISRMKYPRNGCPHYICFALAEYYLLHKDDEASYDFATAIRNVKKGIRMKRKGWNGKNQYIELASNISYQNGNGEIVKCNHDAMGSKAIVFVGTSGTQIGWLASQSDMLAEDWILA